MQKKHIDELKQNNEDKVKEYDTEIQFIAIPYPPYSAMLQPLPPRRKNSNWLLRVKLIQRLRSRRLQNLNRKLKATYPNFKRISVSFNRMTIVQPVGKPLPVLLKKKNLAVFLPKLPSVNTVSQN
jgi:hypothetical protein